MLAFAAGVGFILCRRSANGLVVSLLRWHRRYVFGVCTRCLCAGQRVKHEGKTPMPAQAQANHP
ncbi:hypothetical protein, partial [Paraburkholderia hospita]|uniref:hypothetical protein n=1 Tax=Paraburkholderia hospita TaxID=169430 RepID=UPI001EE68A7B